MLRACSAAPPLFEPNPGATSKAGNGADRAPTVLVVEDEILIRMAVADYLRGCGYRVLEASNAADALAVFGAGESVEVLFSDIHMDGGMTGIALVQWVRARHPNVRVILTSGVTKSLQEAEQLVAGGPLLHKPYAYDALVAHIRGLLGEHA